MTKNNDKNFFISSIENVTKNFAENDVWIEEMISNKNKEIKNLISQKIILSFRETEVDLKLIEKIYASLLRNDHEAKELFLKIKKKLELYLNFFKEQTF